MTESGSRNFFGWLFSAVGVSAATFVFHICRHFLDKGQASLLYLPLVIACAIWFGFGPAVFAAILSFLCWDFFFLPPYGTFVVRSSTDWISLIVFLMAALMTAQLAARARKDAEIARARRDEVLTLFEASESISQTVHAEHLLPELADRLIDLCRSPRCVIFSRSNVDLLTILTDRGPQSERDDLQHIIAVAKVACEYGQVIGVENDGMWRKALSESGSTTLSDDRKISVGIYVPLHADNNLVGVLHLAPRADNAPYTSANVRLIRTLANHAAVVIARQELAKEAALTAALKEADLMKDSLLSLVSHELRSPLAAIKATASGMLEPDAVFPEEATREALAAIDKEADRMTGVVGNLLDLSRLDAGAWKPDKDWCDMSDIVGTVLDRLPASDAVRVHVNISENTPLIKADYIQIALTLTNLVENAIKYTEHGLPINLTIIATEAGGIKVEVRDFGAGIHQDEAPELFQRFYRGSRHKGGIIHGTGIGLALCDAIIRAHGGRIWASNAVDGESRGAVFAFTLPGAEDHAAKSQIATE
jgi:two-component system sensor histidine kinase KdpD